MAIKYLNWDITENYVLKPKYKLQEKQKNCIFKIKLQLQKIKSNIHVNSIKPTGSGTYQKYVSLG